MEKSRQLNWQNKMKEQGKCTKCGKWAVPGGTLCVKCWLSETYKRWDKCKNPSLNTKIIRNLQMTTNLWHKL